MKRHGPLRDHAYNRFAQILRDNLDMDALAKLVGVPAGSFKELNYAFHLPLRWIAAAIAVDLVFGDPAWLPHPVRLIGWLITMRRSPAEWTDGPPQSS